MFGENIQLQANSGHSCDFYPVIMTPTMMMMVVMMVTKIIELMTVHVIIHDGDDDCLQEAWK